MRSAPPSPAEQPLPTGQDLSLPWYLRLPGDLEREFTEYFRETTRGVAEGSSYVLLILGGAGLAVEYLLTGGLAADTWRPRLLALMAITGTYLLARGRRNHYLQPAMAASALVLALTHDYMGCMAHQQLAHEYFYLNAVAVLLLGTLFRVTMFWALPTIMLILAAEALSLIGFSSSSPAVIASTLYFTVTIATMSLLGQYFFERLQRRHFLSERVLSLHRSELHTANRVLESQAREDGLTGTINRRGLEIRLNSLFHARRRGSPRGAERLAILLFDIDFFKQFNDTYGHQAGDECLQQVAGVPSSLIQSETDFVARYGGEEFMVVLVNTTLQDAMVMAERIRARIEQLGVPHETSRVADVITISVGVAMADPLETSPQELIRHADEALYQAKESGRNRVVSLQENGSLRVIR